MLRWAHLLIFSLGLSLLVAVVYETTRHGDMEISVPNKDLLEPMPLSGKAPSFALRDMTGKFHTLDEFKGKWVLLVFWATWCEPCKQELPHLATLAMKLAQTPFFLVMVSVDQSFSDIETMAKQLQDGSVNTEFSNAWKAAALLVTRNGPNFMTLLDPQSSVAKKYGTSVFPESYLIDPRGMLRKKFIGPKPWGLVKALADINSMMK